MGLLRVRELSSLRSEGLPSGTCHLGCNLPELAGKIIIPQTRVKFRKSSIFRGCTYGIFGVVCTMKEGY